MHPVNPKPLDGYRKVIIGEQQTEHYDPLPALASSQGFVLIEFELSDDDRAALAAGGRLRFFQWTGGGTFQPIRLETVTAEAALSVEVPN